MPKDCEYLKELHVYSNGPGYLDCPNMKSKEGDTDMSGEHYCCLICGRREYIDYDEMR